MYGENDPAVPDTACAELDRALRLDAPAYTRSSCATAGVGGDFYRKSTEPLEIAACYDYWQRTIEWLNLRVAPRLTPLAEAWRHRQAVS